MVGAGATTLRLYLPLRSQERSSTRVGGTEPNLTGGRRAGAGRGCAEEEEASSLLRLRTRSCSDRSTSMLFRSTRLVRLRKPLPASGWPACCTLPRCAACCCCPSCCCRRSDSS